MKESKSSIKSVNRGFNIGANSRSGKKSAKSKILYPMKRSVKMGNVHINLTTLDENKRVIIVKRKVK